MYQDVSPSKTLLRSELLCIKSCSLFSHFIRFYFVCLTPCKSFPLGSFDSRLQYLCVQFYSFNSVVIFWSWSKSFACLETDVETIYFDGLSNFFVLFSFCYSCFKHSFQCNYAKNTLKVLLLPFNTLYFLFVRK